MGQSTIHLQVGADNAMIEQVRSSVMLDGLLDIVQLSASTSCILWGQDGCVLGWDDLRLMGIYVAGSGVLLAVSFALMARIRRKPIWRYAKWGIFVSLVGMMLTFVGEAYFEFFYDPFL